MKTDVVEHLFTAAANHVGASAPDSTRPWWADCRDDATPDTSISCMCQSTVGAPATIQKGTLDAPVISPSGGSNAVVSRAPASILKGTRDAPVTSSSGGFNAVVSGALDGQVGVTLSEGSADAVPSRCRDNALSPGEVRCWCTHRQSPQEGCTHRARTPVLD